MNKAGLIGDCLGIANQLMFIFEEHNINEVHIADNTSMIPLLNTKNIPYFIYNTDAKIHAVMNVATIVFLVNPTAEITDKVGPLAVEKNIPIMLCEFI